MIERHFFIPETTVNSEMIRRLIHTALTHLRTGKVNDGNRLRIAEFNPPQHSHFPIPETDFYDEAHLRRAFRHHIGMTPLPYKKEVLPFKAPPRERIESMRMINSKSINSSTYFRR